MDPVPAALSSFVGLFFLFPSDWGFFVFRLSQNDLNEAVRFSFRCAEKENRKDRLDTKTFWSEK